MRFRTVVVASIKSRKTECGAKWFLPRAMVRAAPFALIAALAAGQIAVGQTIPKLTLPEAEALALKNHPQVLAAQSEVSVANELITEARSAYYPAVNADITGTQGNSQARVGAGVLSASRLFDRFGQGVSVAQLVTDMGRTNNLVASTRLSAQATTQTYQATRYDVLLQVTRSYFDVLHAQSLVGVANQTVAARQLLLDQVTTLANNNLKSQLDVSFAGVNVSEAKLLLLRAQNSVQGAFAELARALGSDQPVNYALADEPLPPSPPAQADPLIAEAMANRPELASLQFARDAANKFAEAEKDLRHPTVTVLGVAGLLPFINQPATGPQIPIGYEGAAVNLDIPVFNGHLFTARREAAQYRALEADQRLRDRQQQVARDVRVAWANAVTVYQSIDVSAQFLSQASLALELSQGRYNLGLASIVELTQAQLNVTQAEIENVDAKFDYQSQYSALQYTLGLLR
ncbi:MAG: TolC family protein [Bryobacteraceae bacterium]